jgi:hypothetical protein
MASMSKVEETKSAKVIASFFFLPLFEEEEELLCAHATPQHQRFHLSQTMRKGWKVESFWYFQAISSPSGLLSLFFLNTSILW